MKSNTEEFIQKAVYVNGKKYSYEKVRYANANSKIIISCKLHGDFEQTPSNHLLGRGCHRCGVEKKRSNKYEFIEKAKSIHGLCYSYDKVIYSNIDTNVIITCTKHGDFEQTPYNHLIGKGCLICGIDKTKEKLRSNTVEFIKKSVIVHANKYRYDMVDYVSAIEKVTILCPEHGCFKQAPHDHLQGKGCSKCSINISYISSRWLDSVGIPNDENHREVKKLIPGRRFVVDGYCPETNTIYEFYGDSVHGNPNIYNLDDVGSFGIVYKKLYQKTIDRESVFKCTGFNVVSIWESDFRKQLMHEMVIKDMT